MSRQTDGFFEDNQEETAFENPNLAGADGGNIDDSPVAGAPEFDTFEGFDLFAEDSELGDILTEAQILGLRFGSGEVDVNIWQRLVDCKLSDEQYQSILELMEIRPALWRDCALAFLEDQALRRSFAGLGLEARSEERSGPEVSSVLASSRSMEEVSASEVSASEVSASDVSASDVSASDVSASDVSASGALTGTEAASEAGSNASVLRANPAANLDRSDSTRVNRSARAVRGVMIYLVPVMSAAAGFLLAFASLDSLQDRFYPSVTGESSGTVQMGGAVNVRNAEGSGVAKPLVDRYLNNLQTKMAPEEWLRVISKSEPRMVNGSVSGSLVGAKGGKVKAERKFLIYRATGGGVVCIPVDEYEYVSPDFQ